MTLATVQGTANATAIQLVMLNNPHLGYHSMVAITQSKVTSSAVLVYTTHTYSLELVTFLHSFIHKPFRYRPTMYNEQTT